MVPILYPGSCKTALWLSPPSIVGGVTHQKVLVGAIIQLCRSCPYYMAVESDEQVTVDNG